MGFPGRASASQVASVASSTCTWITEPSPKAFAGSRIRPSASGIRLNQAGAAVARKSQFESSEGRAEACSLRPSMSAIMARPGWLPMEASGAAPPETGSASESVERLSHGLSSRPGRGNRLPGCFGA